MKKLFFIAIITVLACVQVNAQGIKDLWVSQDNVKGVIALFEFKLNNIVEFTAIDLNKNQCGEFKAKYAYNLKRKTFLMSPISKKDSFIPTLYKIKWINKNKMIVTSKAGSLTLARQGTEEDLTTKQLKAEAGEKEKE